MRSSLGRVEYFVYEEDRTVGFIHRSGVFMPAQDAPKDLESTRHGTLAKAVERYKYMGFRVER